VLLRLLAAAYGMLEPPTTAFGGDEYREADRRNRTGFANEVID
jgi:hypothetical protein